MGSGGITDSLEQGTPAQRPKGAIAQGFLLLCVRRTSGFLLLWLTF
jgi:hypothetical protein